MFRIGKKDTIAWPVRVSVPQDGGGVLRAEFTAQFRLLPQARLREVLAAADAGETDADLAAEVLVGWEAVAGEDGEPLAYSEEAKRALLDVVYVRAALLEAYFGMARGKAAARKN